MNSKFIVQETSVKMIKRNCLYFFNFSYNMLSVDYQNQPSYIKCNDSWTTFGDSDESNLQGKSAAS